MEEKKYNYSWVGTPYNDEGFKKGENFYVLDNVTGRKYIHPMIETRKAEDGQTYTQMIVHSNLWNQEFMEFCCSTSPDASKYISKEFITPELALIALRTTSDPEFISKIPRDILTQEMCEISARRFPSSLDYMPEKMIGEILINALIKGYSYEPYGKVIFLRYKEKIQSIMTPELAELIFNKNYRSIEFIPKKFITQEMANKVSKKLGGWPVAISYLPEKFITPEMCQAVVKAKGLYLRYVPQQFITEQLCEDAVESYPRSIAYVPKEFQTLKLQLLAISKNFLAIRSIPREFITPEFILCAIKTNPKVLGSIPKEMITPEMCELAVSLNGNALENVPENLRTYDMCQTAVISNPNMIRKVPALILNDRFYNEIIQNNVIIPKKYLPYVEKCLEVNRRLEDKNVTLTSENVVPTSDTQKYSEFASKDINSMYWLFSIKGTNMLKKYGITTLEQLFIFSDRPDFVSLFSDVKLYREINGTVKLLKCKFLDEAPFPLIDIFDEKLGPENLVAKLGLQEVTANNLSAYLISNEISTKKFFEIMQSEQATALVNDIVGLGKRETLELYDKVRIVIDYNNKHQKKDESLEQLNAELQTLMKERQKIDAQLNIVMAKMQEQMKKLSKGGGLK